MWHARLLHSRRTLLAIAGAAILVGACASSGGSPTTSAAAPEPSTPAASEGAAEGYEVAVATDAKLGDHLVGEGGKSLYIFTKDSGGKSVCNADCAAKWPPFVLEDGETVTAGEGVTGALASIARDDGAMQVTYDGAPLYYFAADAAAGDVNGQGVGGVWFVATPSGASAPSPSSSSSTGGGSEYSRGGGSNASPSP